jgi:hypothetical protein
MRLSHFFSFCVLSLFHHYRALTDEIFCAQEMKEILSVIEFSAFDLNTAQSEIINRALSCEDSEAIYTVGKLFLEDNMFSARNYTMSLRLLSIAGSFGHPSSLKEIGYIYFEGKGVPKSIHQAFHWFNKGASYNDTASLYNCGLVITQYLQNIEKTEKDDFDYNEFDNEQNSILEELDIIDALSFFKNAHLLSKNSSSSSLESVSSAARIAYDITISNILTLPLINMLPNVKRLFQIELETNVKKDQSLIMNLFIKGLHHFQCFRNYFEHFSGKNDINAQLYLKQSFHSWYNLLISSDDHLTDVQLHLLLDNLQDIAGPLSALDDMYTLKASILAEKYAISKYCYDDYAQTESDSSCFNGALSSAMSYYRRINSSHGVLNCHAIGVSHPHASTHWLNDSFQNPRIYIPEIISKPWWKENEFKIVKHLTQSYQQFKKEINTELNQIISLGNEGRLRISDPDIKIENEHYKAQRNESMVLPSMHRIYTPHIGVRVKEADIALQGSGGWSEFGSLFDGLDFSYKKCAIIPTICKILNGHLEELCSTFNDTRALDKESAKRLVESKCGGNTVVTMLRLRPGTHIQGHCGTTNRRLILHWVLRGSTGIKFRVGDPNIKENWVENYKKGDGYAIVFDDSFEHEVIHDGNDDRYVILMVLKHPSLH